MNNFCFLITAFRQVGLTESNIKRIRGEYSTLKNCPIIIVSTSHDDPGFSRLEEYPFVHFIHFKDAPGNPGVSFQHPPGMDRFGTQYLPARILLSMKRGAEFAYQMGIKKMIHLHSDTFWKPEKEQTLLDNILMLDQYSVIGDLSEECEGSVRGKFIIPEKFHIHPEGTLFNLDKCKDIGYLFDFHEIFDYEGGFRSHCYAGIECLLTNFLHWKLSGKNILTYQNEIYPKYFQEIYFRDCRMPHGEFESGLTNLEGLQPTP